MNNQDRVYLEALQRSGALSEIFDAMELNYFKVWKQSNGNRDELHAKAQSLDELRREFNKQAGLAERE